ncbi:proline dehydrogenase 1, mitochondrial [Folsomia candida]|nr:proline dehydrogenase 1, mitochondrial [Folsomia candida]
MLMKATFFGHFVAGEDQHEIAPKIRRMRKFGVNAILDYSAEDDVPEGEEQQTGSQTVATPDQKGSDVVGEEKGLKKYNGSNTCATERKKRAISRVYTYYNEASCDKNTQIFLNSIKAVEGATDGTGFAAIKATAICKPQLLLRISEAIERIHVFIERLTGVNDAVNNQQINIDTLKKRFSKAAKADPAFQAWLDDMDSDSAGIINLVPWKSLLNAKKCVRTAFRIPNFPTGDLEKIVPISDDEIQEFKNALDRFHTIFKAAAASNVRVMVDAEQTYLQVAISRVTIEMMKIYNVEKPMVYNTYQCYLKRAFHDLVTDLNQAERQKFYFGAKLVRGAYMEQERQRANSMGYDDPINSTYASTTEMYEKCMDECLWRIKSSKESVSPGRIKVMAATHNEDTVRFVLRRMKEYDIARDEHSVCFGQLYGMCDQISFPLGQSRYSVYKYVPYGPILKVLPYLSRRALENRGVLGGKTDKERKLLRDELWRRIMKRKWSYNPD